MIDFDDTEEARAIVAAAEEWYFAEHSCQYPGYDFNERSGGPRDVARRRLEDLVRRRILRQREARDVAALEAKACP